LKWRPDLVAQRVLVIGGGTFLGRYIVDALLDAGHPTAVLNRGISSRPAPPGVHHFRGDRGDPQVLADAAAGGSSGGWDVVIDTCAYLPWQVRAAARALRPRRYVLISSISVYASFDAGANLGEDGRCVEPQCPARISGPSYAGAKRACELAVLASDVPAIVLRCGLMTGPGDISSARRYRSPMGSTELDYDSFAGRLPYWPWRFLLGGRVLVPGDPGAPVQVLDVRDIGRWLAGRGLDVPPGVLNTVGERDTFGNWISACSAACPVSTPVWVPDEQLCRHGLDGRLLPMWNPPSDQRPAFFDVPGNRAAELGLRRRPLATTVSDMVEWLRLAAPDDLDVVGSRPLSPAVEAAVVLSWSRRQPAR
jgi:nucleoside-diphosphate-sugar epimerase